MRCDVKRCVTCISNKIEYLDMKQSHKNSTKLRSCIVISISYRSEMYRILLFHIQAELTDMDTKKYVTSGKVSAQVENSF